jgi:hypothetical protein
MITAHCSLLTENPMTNQSNPKHPKYTYQQPINISWDELKAVFGDKDVVKLEYPANEFPMPKTRIIIVFSEQSGKKPQYIQLQDWLELLENYRESQRLAELRNSREIQHQPDMPLITGNEQQYGHGEEFVCIVSFRVNGDEDNVGEAVVSPEERDDCVSAILQKYPNDQLDFSIEFMCKRCFEEMLSEDLEESEYGDYGSGSRMIH